MKILYLVILISLIGCTKSNSEYAKQNGSEAKADTQDLTLPANPPSKSDADKWYSEFRVAKDKAFDGLFIKQVDKHAALNAELARLSQRATELFGEPMTSKLAYCTSSVVALQASWSTASEIVRTGDLETNKPNFIASMAWSGAEHYQECLDALDKLK